MVELRRSGTVDLVRFWSRRWMRTLPAYYVLVLLTFLQAFITRGSRPEWSYLFFGQGYLTNLSSFTVSWSLCVEEHFYLLVGPTVLLLNRLRFWRFPLVAAVFLAPWSFRTLGLYRALEETHVRWDGCVVGVALAAICVFWPDAWRRLCRVAPVLAGVSAVLCGFNLWARWHPGYLTGDLGTGTFALVFGAFVLLANSSDAWGRCLYLPGAGYLAKRAYAVYLLHPEVLALLRRMALPMPHFLVFVCLTWMVTLAVAELMYRLVERPVMRARESFHFSRS
jgi:peptidoglycan/LPS O-acetylase OafA/YrhL